MPTARPAYRRGELVDLEGVAYCLQQALDLT